MVAAYFFDNDDSVDFRQPHNSGENVSLDHLAKLGVIYKHLPSQEEVDSLAEQRGYKNRDIMNLNAARFDNNEQLMVEKMKVFYKEHIHEDEEIRYCMDGDGYFDIKDSVLDRWIRVRLDRYDLIIVPAGIFHRFAVTTNNYIKALRLFKDEPKWQAINKPEADQNPIRKSYLATLQTV
ncbi:probable 1,2-dihydroxy-3-keto-5-methylthiopentene dioxygenase [Zygosaccharomyces bailii]|nr:probable 1,2-dihydroxy-3-keto-5-methylthiopentene dioxygenase [Zygosaccharomyces bailii]